MDTKSKSEKSEDAYWQYERAPLAALALIIADWVKLYGISSLVKRPIAGKVDSSDEVHSPRQ